MKNFFFIISCVAWLSLGMSGCSGTETPLSPTLVLSSTSLQFNKNAGEQIITATSDQKITFSSNQFWCRVNGGIDQTSNEGFQITKITIAVDENSSTENRTAQITIKSGALAETIIVKQAANSNESKGSDAMTLVSKMTIGWNLGNSLEATDGNTASETMWGNPKTTKTLIDLVKSSGFNAIRIPCAWNAYISNSTTYQIKESWLNRVQEVVNYCLENDMFAIINIHWDGGWLENNCTPDKQEANNAKQHALWTQIATHFRDYDEHLLFAGTNEPNVSNATQMSVLNSYLQTFINAVRATGGNNSYRNLIIQGPSTDIEQTNALVNTLPVDQVENRLIYEIHYYSPWNFCGLTQDESWGKMFYFWGKDYHFPNSNRNASWGEEDFVITQFKSMKTKFIDKNIPVLVGEFGAIKRKLNTQTEQDAHDVSRLYFLEYVTRQSIVSGLVPFYWDNGAAESQIFDRHSIKVSDQRTLDALMRGVN